MESGKPVMNPNNENDIVALTLAPYTVRRVLVANHFKGRQLEPEVGALVNAHATALEALRDEKSRIFKSRKRIEQLESIVRSVERLAKLPEGL